MRMKATEHITNGRGALAIGFIRGKALGQHRIENTTVHRLKSVSHIRQSTVSDDAHGIVDKRLPHLFIKIHRDDDIIGIAESFIDKAFLFFLALRSAQRTFRLFRLLPGSRLLCIFSRCV